MSAEHESLECHYDKIVIKILLDICGLMCIIRHGELYLLWSTYMANNYIDNKKFLTCIIDHRDENKKLLDNNERTLKIPEYVGECFLKIAEHLSRKPNFISYSFREEMISDGIENCILYYGNFDPAKSSNPFSYFTQIIYFAFLRRIAKEKMQLYVKYKATKQTGILDEDELLMDQNGHTKQFDVYDNIDEFITTFEEFKNKKKIIPKQKPKGIQLFYDEEENV